MSKDKRTSEQIRRDILRTAGPAPVDHDVSALILAAKREQREESMSNLDKLVEAVRTMRLALEHGKRDVDVYIKDIGGCEHNVGICCCGLGQTAYELEAARAALRTLVEGWPLEFNGDSIIPQRLVDDTRRALLAAMEEKPQDLSGLRTSAEEAHDFVTGEKTRRRR